MTTIAGNSGETNALTEASSMIAGYAPLKSTYGLDSGGISVYSPTISWDFGVEALTQMMQLLRPLSEVHLPLFLKLYCA
jgi:hypothetical protein